jgi:hypothetical protein
LFCNLNIMLIACLNYLCYIYYFFNTLIKYNELQTLDSLIFTWFTNSKDTYIFYILWIHSSLPASFIPRTKTFNFVPYRNIHFSIPIIFDILHFLQTGFTNRYLIHLFQGLKCLTLPIIETHSPWTYTCISICHFRVTNTYVHWFTLACHIFKISQFNIYTVSNQVSLIFLLFLFLIPYIIIII